MYKAISHQWLLNKSFALRVALGIILMFACAQVEIPLQPVPITLHTVGVLIIGLTYSKREAVTTLITYLLLGSIGMPMFAGLAGGFNHLIGKTGGYLFGMVLAVYVMTHLREKFGEDSLLKLTAYSIIGSICVFLLGLPQLALFVGFTNAIKFGLFPFIIPGIVKALFTVASIRLLKTSL